MNLGIWLVCCISFAGGLGCGIILGRPPWGRS